MPVSFEIFPAKRLVEVSYSGQLTIGEILKVREEVTAHPDFDPSYNVLDDITGVFDSDINFSDLAGVTGRSIVQTGVKRALLAETEFQYGMARTYQMLSESSGHLFKLFREREAALVWLDE